MHLGVLANKFQGAVMVINGVQVYLVYIVDLTTAN